MWIAEKRKPSRLPSWLGQEYSVSITNTPEQLSREAIEEFKAVYEDEFGESLTEDEVQEMAVRLVHFFGILLKPTRVPLRK